MNDKHNESASGSQAVNKFHRSEPTTLRLPDGDTLIIESGGVTITVSTGTVTVEHPNVTRSVEVFSPKCGANDVRQTRGDITTPQPAGLALAQHAQSLNCAKRNATDTIQVSEPVRYESSSYEGEDEIPSS